MPVVPNALQNFDVKLGNQAAEGTPAASWHFGVPYFGGNLSPVQDAPAFEVTDSANLRPGIYTRSKSWGGSLQFGAFPHSAALFFAALLGLDTPTGTAPSYLHTISNVDANARWLTAWLTRPTVSPATLVDRFEDGTVTGVELVYEYGQPVRLGVDLVGKTVTTAVTAPTAFSSAAVVGIQESYSARQAVATATPTAAAAAASVATFTFSTAHPFRAGDVVIASGFTPAGYNGVWVVATVPSTTTFTATIGSSPTAGTAFGPISSTSFLSSIGGTIKMDPDVSPAATTVVDIESMSIKITRATTLMQTGSLTPTFRSQGLYDVAISATAVLDTQALYNFYRLTYFGGTAGSPGTTLTPVVVTGALDVTLFEAPTAGTSKLQLQLPNVDFNVDPHAFDPAGGPAKIAIAASVLKAASGSSIIPIITNGMPSLATS